MLWKDLTQDLNICKDHKTVTPKICRKFAKNAENAFEFNTTINPICLALIYFLIKFL